MDETVLRAMAKWPNVPAVYGWLSLNQRGQWLIKNELIAHPAMVDYIGRNYADDVAGQWYFQNGPQRVFVALALAPLVLRVPYSGQLQTHNGMAVQEIRGAWLDSNGALYLRTNLGPGVMDDRDAELLTGGLADRSGRLLDEDALIASLERLQGGERDGLMLDYLGCRVEVLPIAAAAVAERLGFVREPRPALGEEACT